MNASRIAPLVAALTLTAPVDLLGQQQEPYLRPGDRVRVAAPDVFPGRLVGGVVAVKADTLVIQFEKLLVSPFSSVRDHTGHAPLALPHGSLTSLEVSAGRKSNVLKGAGIGSLVGGGLGAAIGFAGCAATDCFFFEPITALEGAAILAVPGTVVGLLIGTAIGAASRSDRWEPVPLDDMSVSLTPGRNRMVAIRVSLAH